MNVTIQVTFGVLPIQRIKSSSGSYTKVLRMNDTPNKPSDKPLRGFAALTPEQRSAVGRKGGISVNAQNRAFSRDANLARSAGEKGGRSVPADKRAFSLNKSLASVAGKKSRRKTLDCVSSQD